MKKFTQGKRVKSRYRYPVVVKFAGAMKFTQCKLFMEADPGAAENPDPADLGSDEEVPNGAR